jgi:dolichol-phosphate mannosyltransferase
MSHSPYLSVVVPTFREADNLKVLIPQLQQVLGAVGRETEIVIVDDFTDDGTTDLIRGFQAEYGNIELLTRRDERGIASAWIAGLDASRGEVVAIMDADLSHDPVYVRAMVEHVGDHGLVIGSRYLPGSKSTMPEKSRVAIALSMIGQKLFRMFIGLRIYDASHSLRAFKRATYEVIRDELRFDGNVMMMEFTYLAQKKGVGIHEIPMQYKKRGFGETKLNLFTQGLKFLKALFLIRFYH